MPSIPLWTRCFQNQSRSIAAITGERSHLVRLWGLLHHKLGRGHSDGDASGLQSIEDLLVAELVPGVVPAARSASPMAGRAKGLFHAPFSPCMHMPGDCASHLSGCRTFD